MKHSFLCKISACVLSMGLLAGCETYNAVINYFSTDEEVKCPDAKVLLDASVLPAFAPTENEGAETLVYTATMSSANLDCVFRKKQNKARSSISITFHAVRPSGGAKAVYKVPYFLALTTNGRVLYKKLYWKKLAFEKGETEIDTEVDIDGIVLKPSKRKRVINYHYIVGFQLTQAQLAYAKKMELYAQ